MGNACQIEGLRLRLEHPGNSPRAEVVVDEGDSHAQDAPGDKSARCGQATGKLFQVFGDLDHGRSFFLHDLGGDLPVLLTRNLESAIDIGKVRGSIHLAMAAQPAQERLEDTEGHPAQGCGGLVAVDPLLKVYLRERLQAPSQVNVEEVGGFHPVSDWKWNALEDLAADRVFSRERLEELSELGVKEREKGADEDLGYSTATGRTDSTRGVGDWTLVEGFYIAEALIPDEGGDQPINKARVNIGDVGVDIADDVTLQLVDGLPEVLTLSTLEATGWENVSRVVKISTVLLGPFPCAIGRAGINHRDFIEKGEALHELALEDGDLLSNCLFLIKSRNAKGHAKA